MPRPIVWMRSVCTMERAALPTRKVFWADELDYTHPVMLVSENEKELQRVYEAIS